MKPELAKREITVLLADDHRLVRTGFRRILDDDPELRVVGEAGNGREALELALRLEPDVIVMDLAMPDLDGVQASVEILKKLPDTAILILSMHAEENYVRNAFQAGAKGYLLKNAIEVDLTAAVKAVAAGQEYRGPGLTQGAAPSDGFDRLTQRERQVLRLIAEGKSNKEIAWMLGLSVNTISVHRANLMEALNIHRTAELVLFAVKKGLVGLS
ncbi:MAG: response regulator transcription factor [Bryobacterales bacterium]|nr:response regulator transcription factor [Bryobacterales bacterium]